LAAYNDPTYGFGNMKLVYGEMKDIVKNQFVTGIINDRLAKGVIFVV